MAEYTKTALGEKAYLWCANNQPAETCAINAQGGQILPSVKSVFTVPRNMRLFFYCPHGVALSTTDFAAIPAKQRFPYEVLGGGDLTYNYGLCKWQESRDNIPAMLTDRPVTLQRQTGIESRGRFASLKKFTRTTKPAASNHWMNSNPIDLITLRHGADQVQTNLYDILKELSRLAPHNLDVYCNFSRGTSGSYDATNNVRPVFDSTFTFDLKKDTGF